MAEYDPHGDGPEDDIAAAAALLMREVICELAYRGRQALKTTQDTEHIVRALKIRKLRPRQIIGYAKPEILTWEAADVRELAVTVLDALEAQGVFE